MGNVQSESTQESESPKDGEEKAKLDRSKPSWGPSGTKRETRSRSPGPQTAELKGATQPQGKELGGVDRQTGAAEMGKSNSKKSKLKLSSMWTQNLSSGGIKEASLCDKGPVTERRGLACLSRADLQSGQGTGSILPGEQKGLKAPLKPPQGVAHDHRDSSTRKEAAKGKSKAEQVSLGLLLQPERMMELGPTITADEDATETKVCCTQHIKASPREYSENEGLSPNSVPSPQKQPESSMHCPAPLKMKEDATGAPRFLSKRSINRPVPSCGVAPPGGKKVLLSWGSEEKDREKEQAGQQDRAPGSDGDSKGPAAASQMLAEHATTSSSPVEKCPASGSDGGKNEEVGAEVVSSETMHELLERGLNFLYKVTIQPGQWPPSIKAVKQKAGLLPPGISYTDILKQCPQKAAAAGAPATHHLTMTGKKPPSFKGMERSNPEDLSSLKQLFLEHFQKVTPKEPASQVPSQQVVTFLEELSTASPKEPEWQRPRPPTPYPQRRKGRSRKLPKFDAAAPQTVTFLGSDSKCDWLVHDESQMSLDDAIMVAEEGGVDSPEQPSAGKQEVGSPPSLPALLLEQEIAEEVDKSRQRSRQKLPGPEDGAKETVPLKSPPCNLTQGILSPLATVPSSQTEDPPPVPLPNPKSHPPNKTPELSSPTGSAPCGPTGPAPEQKAPAVVQARSKVQKQDSAALKPKENFKSSGQHKAKGPKGKGQKQRLRGGGVMPSLKLQRVPLFTPFEKVARPFYFGEPLEGPFSQDEPAATKEDMAPNQDGPVQDPEVLRPAEHCQWPAFQVVDSCPRKCYCRHQDKRKLPKNVVAWLNPSTNHLAEPPWAATALLAISLVAGTKFCLDSYCQRRLAHED